LRNKKKERGKGSKYYELRERDGEKPSTNKRRVTSQHAILEDEERKELRAMETKLAADGRHKGKGEEKKRWDTVNKCVHKGDTRTKNSEGRKRIVQGCVEKQGIREEKEDPITLSVRGGSAVGKREGVRKNEENPDRSRAERGRRSLGRKIGQLEGMEARESSRRTLPWTKKKGGLIFID